MEIIEVRDSCRHLSQFMRSFISTRQAHVGTVKCFIFCHPSSRITPRNVESEYGKNSSACYRIPQYGSRALIYEKIGRINCYLWKGLQIRKEAPRWRSFFIPESRKCFKKRLRRKIEHVKEGNKKEVSRQWKSGHYEEDLQGSATSDRRKIYEKRSPLIYSYSYFLPHLYFWLTFKTVKMCNKYSQKNELRLHKSK